jgi:ABC-2 type transport system permease protein
MISALLYLQYHSIRNRIVMRVKRLKQPKYLFGAVVGGLYFYWYFFRVIFRGSGRSQGLAMLSSPENLLLYQSIGALALLVIVSLAWIIPHQRAALTFTEAEVAFLFPAPISRRNLIHFKLLRSQTAILFTTLLLTLMTSRLGGQGWIRAAGAWVVLSTLSLHFLGSSFAMTRLLDQGISTWKRRLGILALLIAGIGAVFIWARHALPPLDLERVADPNGLKDYFQQLLAAGPAPYLLYPFRIVVRPFLAPTPLAFVQAFWPALLLMLLHYAWVVRSNVAFEEASVQASQKMAEKLALVRSGNWQAANRKARKKRPPFKLRPSGSPAVALLWKNLISAGQAFSLRIWISLAVFAVCAVMGISNVAGANLRLGLVMLSAMLLAWSVLVGPQLLRHDFRQDLQVADLLKSYPMRGWQLALGEVLAPVAALTGIQWLALIVMLALSWGVSGGGLKWADWAGITFGAALLLPALNMVIFQIPNAAALAFPAWFQTTKGGPQGIEATGQRLIFMVGQFLVLIVALLPAAALFVGVFFLGGMMLPRALCIFLGAAVATIVLALEAALGIMLLGWLFDRFDVAGEQGS